MDKYYEDYWYNKSLDDTPHAIWKKSVLSKIDLNDGNYLDIGCGNGFISEQFLYNHKVYGLDISENALKEANKKGLIVNKHDFSEKTLPFQDSYFDNIICLDVLEHLQDPENLTNEVHRILKNNALFIVCVPNMLNIFNRIMFLFGEFYDVMDTSHRTNELFSEHIKVFSKKKFELLLNKYSFKIKKRYYYFPDKLSERRKLQFICNILNALKLHLILPKLFALGFLYVCEKVTGEP